MTSAEKKKVERLRGQNPAALYDHPREIVRDRHLSAAEKLALIEEWERDVRLMLVASEENMTGPTPVSLADVLKAKADLTPDAQTSPQVAKI